MFFFLRNTFRLHGWIVAGGMVGSVCLNACHDNAVSPHKNSPPESSLEVSPLFGVSPLEVRIKGEATDPDGKDDIANYRIVLRNNVNPESLVFTKNPTDTSIVLNNLSNTGSTTYNVESRVVDRSGAQDVKGPLQIEIGKAQSAALQNKVDIQYEANLSGIPQATLEVRRNGNLEFTRNITTQSYSENFKGMKKGDYEFFLSWKSQQGPDLSDKVNVTVPNYLPEINLSGLQADMDEGGEISLNLEGRITDDNWEDNPVPLIGATPLDDKTSESTNEKIINIESLPGKTGDYEVAIQVGSEQGGIITKTSEGTIYDLLDLEGVLEDNETHSRQPGIIKVYDSDSVKIGEMTVDNSGQFSTRFNKRVIDLTDWILIQGRKIDSTTGENKSYVRTLRFPRGDVTNLTIRVIPYDGLAENGINPQQFKQFMYELSLGDEVPLKFDLDNLKGIQILTENPYGVQYGTFNSGTQQQVRDKILDENDINGIIGDYRIKPEHIFIGNNPTHFTLDSTAMSVTPDIGWIIVTPATYINLAGATAPYTGGKKIFSSGTIYVRPDAIFNIGIFSHEFEHVFIPLGNVTTIGQTKQS